MTRAKLLTRRSTSVFGALAAATLVFTACGTPNNSGTAEADITTGSIEDAKNDPHVTLTFGHYLPPNDVMHVEVIEPFAEEVEKLTGGSVTIDIHPAGALGAQAAIYENVQAGVQDIGLTVGEFNPGVFPLSEALSLPFVSDSTEAAHEALWDIYENVPEFQEEYSGTKTLALWAPTSQQIFTTGEPVETATDMEGKRIRVVSQGQSNFSETLGSDPVNLATGDVYDAAERGIIDGALAPPSMIRGVGLDEVMDSFTVCNCGYGAIFVPMNEGSWNKLTNNQQLAIEQAMGGGVREFSDKFKDVLLEAEVSDFDALEDAGLTKKELTSEEREQWKSATKGLVDEWFEANRDLPGASDMAEFLNLN